jgi:protein-S-isoprenylcysteine O-methyltransferase Ste14
VTVAGGLRRIHGHLVLALLGLVLARPGLVTNLAGSGLVAVGLALRLWAAGVLEKGGGLCTDGPYQYIRHPLYVGSFLAAVGFCVMMNVVWGWALVLPLFVALYAAQMSLEERHLRAEYEDRHAAYAARVPMLVPRLAKERSGNGRAWRVAQVLVNREQYHVLVTLVLVGLFYVKWCFWR